MELTALLAVVAVALLAVLLLVRGQQQRYQGNVAQLYPEKPKRELKIGSWTRADVAQRATPDDCWLIICDRRDRKLKVGRQRPAPGGSGSAMQCDWGEGWDIGCVRGPLKRVLPEPDSAGAAAGWQPAAAPMAGWRACAAGV